MKHSTIVLASIMASTAAITLPTFAAVGPVQGEREFTLGGAGTSDEDFDNNVFGAAGSLGWFLSDRSEWGFRQQINYSKSVGTSSVWGGATDVFYDYHFGDGKARPFIGASLGYLYGENTDDSFIAGPEVGVKYYALEKTFIYAKLSYEFLFEDADQINDRYDDGAVFYGVGVGFNY